MATNKLITETVNLSIPPRPSDELSVHYNQITIGDLHANALKFIHFLLRHKILELNDEDYKKLVEIYSTRVTELTQAHIKQFNQIIDRAKVNLTNELVRLIGDELSDRGANDYFILKILQKLYQAGTKVEILLSNHGYEFLQAYLICKRDVKEGFYARDMVGSLVDGNLLKDILAHPKSELGKNFFQAQSINALQLAMNAGCFERDEVLALAEGVYLPMLKAISYTISEDRKEITIYSHAGIGLNTLKALAEKIGIPYDDSSVDYLIDTIDCINTKFKEKISKGEISTLFDKEIIKAISRNKPIIVNNKTINTSEEYPWESLIWNRNYEQISRPLIHNGIVFHWVHGHDHRDLSKKNIYNLDQNNDVGHSMEKMQGSQNYLLSNECVPYLGINAKKREDAMQKPGKRNFFKPFISFLSRLKQRFNTFTENHPKPWRIAKFIFKYLLIPATVAAIFYFTGGLAALGSIPIVGGYITSGLASAGGAVAGWIGASGFSAALAAILIGLSSVAVLTAVLVKAITAMVDGCRPKPPVTRQERNVQREEEINANKTKNRTCCSLTWIAKKLGLKSSGIGYASTHEERNETPPPISATNPRFDNVSPPPPTFTQTTEDPVLNNSNDCNPLSSASGGEVRERRSLT